MNQMATWEMLLLGVLVALVLFWMGPGVKATFERSRQAEHKDWRGFLLPIIAVILFVLLLVNMV